MAALSMSTPTTPTYVSWPRIFIAIVITLVWAVLMLVDAFSQSFAAPQALNGALAVVAYILGKEASKVVTNGGNGK